MKKQKFLRGCFSIASSFNIQHCNVTRTSRALGMLELFIYTPPPLQSIATNLGTDPTIQLISKKEEFEKRFCRKKVLNEGNHYVSSDLPLELMKTDLQYRRRETTSRPRRSLSFPRVVVTHTAGKRISKEV